MKTIKYTFNRTGTNKIKYTLQHGDGTKNSKTMTINNMANEMSRRLFNSILRIQECETLTIIVNIENQGNDE